MNLFACWLLVGAGISKGGRQRASDAGGRRRWVSRVHGADVVSRVGPLQFSASLV